MKPHIIYLLIAIATLVLNVILTVAIFKRLAGSEDGGAVRQEEVITFRLKRKASDEDNTIAAVVSDDTVPLE